MQSVVRAGRCCDLRGARHNERPKLDSPFADEMVAQHRTALEQCASHTDGVREESIYKKRGLRIDALKLTTTTSVIVLADI